MLDRLDSLYFVVPAAAAMYRVFGILVRRPATPPRGVAVLGSTGSIGRSTLAVLRRQREHFRVVALTGGRNADAFEAQVAEWRPAFAGLAAGTQRHAAIRADPSVLVQAATHPDVDVVVNAVVGAAGLDATLAALRAGKRVALANKETLVMAGELVAQAACAGGGELVPVDSEHSAVLQCVSGRDARLGSPDPHRSGGPVPRVAAPSGCGRRRWRRRSGIRPGAWDSKITVDSATLANKALELIEAHHLFGLPYDALEVVVHPQSIVHAFVEFCDGSVIAQLGFPSMELPILYALTHPGAAARRGRAPRSIRWRPGRSRSSRCGRTCSARSPRASRPGARAASRRRCSMRPTRWRSRRSSRGRSRSAASARSSSGRSTITRRSRRGPARRCARPIAGRARARGDYVRRS